MDPLLQWRNYTVGKLASYYQKYDKYEYKAAKCKSLFKEYKKAKY